MSELYVCGLSEPIQKMASEQLNEDPQTRDEKIEMIRQWIHSQEHINARTDTYTILRYLRGCKFSIEKTKRKIEKYYSFKTIFPEMFMNRDPTAKSLQLIYNLKLMVPLPGYDSEGRKVILGRLGAWDPTVVNPEDLFRAASMLFDVLFLEDEQISVTGFVQVHDMAGLTFSHVAALNFALIKKVMTIWTEGYAIRPKAVHYINTPTAFKTVFQLFSLLMKPKMRNRIKIHGSDMESLYKHVPKEMFPIEYGGNRYTLTEINDSWETKLLRKSDWFKDEENYKVRLTDRPGTLQTIAEYFKLDGYFKNPADDETGYSKPPDLETGTFKSLQPDIFERIPNSRETNFKTLESESDSENESTQL